MLRILWPDNLEQAVLYVNFFAVSTKILLAVVRRGKRSHHPVARENLPCVSIKKGGGMVDTRDCIHGGVAHGAKDDRPLPRSGEGH